MNKNHGVSFKVTSSILSMSLLTVMAGAAIAPALNIIRLHFNYVPHLLVQLIVSSPALFIILTNLFFLRISRRYGSRTIAITGLLLYVVAGTNYIHLSRLCLHRHCHWYRHSLSEHHRQHQGRTQFSYNRDAAPLCGLVSWTVRFTIGGLASFCNLFR